jgi:hypothetical protein
MNYLRKSYFLVFACLLSSGCTEWYTKRSPFIEIDIGHRRLFIDVNISGAKRFEVSKALEMENVLCSSLNTYICYESSDIFILNDSTLTYGSMNLVYLYTKIRDPRSRSDHYAKARFNIREGRMDLLNVELR